MEHPVGTCLDCDVPTPESAVLPGDTCPAGHLMRTWEAIDEVEEGEFVTVIWDADLNLSFFEIDNRLADRIAPSHPTWATWVHTYFDLDTDLARNIRAERDESAARGAAGVAALPEAS